MNQQSLWPGEARVCYGNFSDHKRTQRKHTVWSTECGGYAGTPPTPHPCPHREIPTIQPSYFFPNATMRAQSHAVAAPAPWIRAWMPPRPSRGGAPRPQRATRCALLRRGHARCCAASRAALQPPPPLPAPPLARGHPPDPATADPAAIPLAIAAARRGRPAATPPRRRAPAADAHARVVRGGARAARRLEAGRGIP